MISIIKLTKKQLIARMWDEAPPIMSILTKAKSIQDARNSFFNYLNELERNFFNIYSPERIIVRHIIERNNAKECIRVLKNILRTENEKLTDFSALKSLYYLAKSKNEILQTIHEGFICEFIFLFRGIYAKSNLESKYFKKFSSHQCNENLKRTEQLNSYARHFHKYFDKFSLKGNAHYIPLQRLKLKKRILSYFSATETDWHDYQWHLKNLFKTKKQLLSVIKLEKDEIAGLNFAEKNSIPFHITPYYLSLFIMDGRTSIDRGIRAQVLPSLNYGESIVENRKNNKTSDFMGEQFTTPIQGITRRYPEIAILKPFDACPQICVYCQRNWEITDYQTARISKSKITSALNWIKNNKHLREVLVTGGDPLTLDNEYINWIFSELASVPHIERIRIGTRVFVTLPCRINDNLLGILRKFHQWGKREIALMTHIQSPLEITPECLEAVKKIKSIGINIYNQQVFTYYNSRRFETSYLRKTLKLHGVDPYYTFNTKGKNETIDFRIPIARIEQERKEEARLLPGLSRTDEPVFNVPLQGKSNLIAWQDHEPIMILSNGRRVYRFYPWESHFTLSDDYLYTDVSIYDYLKRLSSDGENVSEYSSIWYYF